MRAVFEKLKRGMGAWALGVALVAACVTPVSAQKSAHATENKYQDLIRRALEEYSSGNWTEARVFFEDAHAISPNARTLRGLGMTSYEARSYVEAISFLGQALASQARPLTPELAKEARSVLEQARRFVSAVTIELEPMDAELRVDGKVVTPRQRDELLLDPGEHEFTATADGFEPGRRVMISEGGRRLNVHLVLASEHPVRGDLGPAPPRVSQTVAAPTAPVEPQPEPPAEPSVDDQSVVPGVILAVLGAGALGTGWVFYSLRQDIRLLPLENDLSVVDLDNFHNHGSASLALAGLGAALLAVSEYFWLPNDTGVPVWAWPVGALGVAVGVVGVALATLGPNCELREDDRVRVSCQSFTSDLYFGPLIAMHALPLLAVPISYALRAAVRPSDVEVSLQWGNGRALGPGLTIVGRF
jgi:hypothetical protein